MEIKIQKKGINSPNPCAASAMITSAEHGCSLFVLSLFFLVVLVLLFAHVVEDEDANSRRRAAAEDDDDKSSLRSIIGFVWCALFLLKKMKKEVPFRSHFFIATWQKKKSF